jgi:hypothetical protein
MKIYIAKRQAGKTTMLVKESAKTGATIVVATRPMIGHVNFVAKELGLDIPTPISVSHYIQILAQGGPPKEKKYLVDELQMMLSQMGVEIATVDEKYVFSLWPYYIPDGLSAGLVISDEFATEKGETHVDV